MTGAVAFAAVLAFMGLAVAALLSFDTGAASAALFDAYTLRILRFTLWEATLSTALSIALGLPVALALARQRDFPGRIWIIRLMAVPMGLPVIVGALGLIAIWGRQGIFNTFLLSAGVEQPFSIYGLSGILIAHVFFNLPLAVRFFWPGWSGCRRNIGECARALVLGSSRRFGSSSGPPSHGCSPAWQG